MSEENDNKSPALAITLNRLGINGAASVINCCAFNSATSEGVKRLSCPMFSLVMSLVTDM